MIGWITLIIFIILLVRVKRRGYFWKAKDGEELKFKEFISKWKEGVVNCTPLQQTKITLWSFMPMFAGIIWGIGVTFLGKTYWMTLILGGSLPLTSIQFLSNIQKYRTQKRIEDTMKELNKKQTNGKNRNRK